MFIHLACAKFISNVLIFHRSLARAFDPAVLHPHLPKLGSQMLCVAVTDREINVRRAASAAFQVYGFIR